MSAITNPEIHSGVSTGFCPQDVAEVLHGTISTGYGHFEFPLLYDGKESSPRRFVWKGTATAKLRNRSLIEAAHSPGVDGAGVRRKRARRISITPGRTETPMIASSINSKCSSINALLASRYPETVQISTQAVPPMTL